MRGQMKT